MTPEEWAKYGPKSNLKRRGAFIISEADIMRVSKRKRQKKAEG
jgi:hypothetical protein